MKIVVISSKINTEYDYIPIEYKEDITVYNRLKKENIMNLIEDKKLYTEDIIVLKDEYEFCRDWTDIISIYNLYRKNELRSLLCRTTSNDVLYDLGNNRGYPVLKDARPKIFQVSHYIIIFKGSEITKLNDNFYNENTFFYPIDDVL